MRPTLLLRQAKTQQKPVLLIVSSIGNPEPQYSHTRHNMGHEVLNALVPRTLFRDKSPWSGCSIAVHHDVMYLKTLDYMNLSGNALAPAWRAIQAQFGSKRDVRFLVLYDEMDKAVGKYQLRHGKVSSRGHNGLKNIVECHGNDYYRLGVGIGRPDSKHSQHVADYVLSRIPQRDWEVVERSVIPSVAEVIEGLKV